MWLSKRPEAPLPTRQQGFKLTLDATNHGACIVDQGSRYSLYLPCVAGCWTIALSFVIVQQQCEPGSDSDNDLLPRQSTMHAEPRRIVGCSHTTKRQKPAPPSACKHAFAAGGMYSKAIRIERAAASTTLHTVSNCHPLLYRPLLKV